MPVISFASPKGGSGKTTSAIILVCELAQKADVIMIDADPAARSQEWNQRGKKHNRIEVISCSDEDKIQDVIDDAAARAPFVIVDMEGAATNLNSMIIGQSDLVIIPTGDEQQDATAALRAIRQVGQVGRTARREIPARVLFARTKTAVKARNAKDINAELRDAAPAFGVELNDRTAFSSLHSYGGTLYDLDGKVVGGLPRAIENSVAFASEVIEVLRGAK